MERTIEAEILDRLAPDDPAALHNRRDLRLTNRAMGNHRWIAQTLQRLVQPDDRVLELGAGTGELGLRLAHLGIKVDGLDLWPRPLDWPASQAWHQSDILTFKLWTDYSVIVGNLIFHQFSETDLRSIGQQLQRARSIVACEPLRRRLSQVGFRLIAPLFGANYVSLHDAHVSIAAGFAGAELPGFLGLTPAAWNVTTTTTPRGAYRMVAAPRP